MSENESRPLERWSTGQVMWSGRTSEFMNAYTTGGEIDVIRAKAAALDKILAAWGMTWDEYSRQRTETSVLAESEWSRPSGEIVLDEITAMRYMQHGTDATGDKKCD